MSNRNNNNFQENSAAELPQRRRIWPWVVGALTVVAVVTVAGIVLVRKAYDNGLLDGVAQLSEEISGDLNSLADAVANKAQLIANLSEVLADVPSEVNADDIEAYINKLQSLIDQSTQPEVQQALQAYQGKWQELKEVYATEDNAEIQLKFNEAKSAAGDTAQSIREFLDGKIREAVDGLGE